MKAAVIQSAWMTMRSGMGIKESIILNYTQKDELDAGMLMAAYYLIQDPEAAVISINAVLSGRSMVAFPGDLGIDRHGFIYVASGVTKVPGGTKPIWVKTNTAFAFKKMQKIIQTMQAYANEKSGGPSV